ncbi:MAG: potassium-transporting ATPase subunit KdpA [Thermoanaerobaculia bacterium]
MLDVVLKTGIYFLLVLAVVKPIGLYMKKVFSKEKTFLDPVLMPLERLLYRVGGIDATREQGFVSYAGAMMVFNVVSLVVLYAMERWQHLLPLNPDKMPAVPPALAWNTAVSFTTNTNWQAYSGESTMSLLTQMAGLAVHNFASAATGIAIAIAFVRGVARTESKGIGNFWSDLVRSILWVLLPLSLIGAVVLMSQGVIQNFKPSEAVTTLEGASQKVPQGPIASQEAIKELGTNGGGFVNANSAHPYENPTPFSNLVEMFLIFSVGGALTYTLGAMTGKTRHGWAVFWSMAIVFLVGALLAGYFEVRGNPIHHGLGVSQAMGNMEGKEVRFGPVDSALFATITTDASCGAVNAMHDSFTPLGGLIPLLNIQLGEIIFGGVGAGLYGMLLFVVLSVFIAGLMVGRTPEYLGKKIEAKEVKLAMLSVLILTFSILVGTAVGIASKPGLAGLNNAGPHGLSEILYAFTSATGNNGSAFAGLNANSDFYNVALGLAMFFGRFLMIIPLLGIAGSLAAKKKVAESIGTFPVDGPIFVLLLISVILIVGALTFFPALSLGPIVEHLLMNAARLF